MTLASSAISISIDWAFEFARSFSFWQLLEDQPLEDTGRYRRAARYWQLLTVTGSYWQLLADITRYDQSATVKHQEGEPGGGEQRDTGYAARYWQLLSVTTSYNRLPPGGGERRDTRHTGYARHTPHAVRLPRYRLRLRGLQRRRWLRLRM